MLSKVRKTISSKKILLSELSSVYFPTVHFGTTIEDLHSRCRIVIMSLEQRRRNQLLLLMYKQRNDVSLLKVFPRNTHRSTLKVFKTANFEGTLYKRSPFYVGAKLWDSMAEHDIDMPDIYTFKNRLKKLQNVYIDLFAP